jgi:hypothetical protein
MNDAIFRPHSKRKWRFTFDLLQPSNLKNKVGELPNVLLDTVTISEGYYVDERVSCSLDYIGEIKDHRAWVRIRANSDDGFSFVLGTFIPKEESVSIEQGVKKTSLKLASVLYGLSCEYRRGLCICSKGAHVYDMFKDICSHVPFNEEKTLAECNNTIFTSTTTCEVGNSELKYLFDIANQTTNRVHVTEMGEVWLGKYLTPNQLRHANSIDLSNGSDGVIEGISRETNYLSEYMSCVIYATKDEETLIGLAYKGDFNSEWAKRGYINTYSRTLNDLEPFTQAEANARARKHLSMRNKIKNELTVSCLWRPIYHEGTGVLAMSIPDLNGYRGYENMLVKSVELKLATMTCKLVLRDIDSGEEVTSNEE